MSSPRPQAPQAACGDAWGVVMTTQSTRSFSSGRPRNTASRAVADVKASQPKGRVYHFAYLMRARDGRRLLPHQVRDATPALMIFDILRMQGYAYGSTILNYPMPRGTPTIEVDHTFLGRRDLLLLAGRPPMDDENWPLKRGLARSHTSLEDKVFASLRPCFREVARSHVWLADAFARACPRAVFEKASITFRQNAGASYLYTNSPDTWPKAADEDATAAYMVFQPEIWPGGPDVLAAFAMGGTETLGWAHLLRTRFAHLVGVPGFVMAEMITTPPPESTSDLSFVDEWRVEILTGEKPVPVDGPTSSDPRRAIG
jgi:hypothetical protein